MQSNRWQTQVPADDFQALEEKIYRTIDMYKAARQAQATAERDAQRLRQQMEDRDGELVTLRREMVQLKKSGKRFAGASRKCCSRSSRSRRPASCSSRAAHGDCSVRPSTDAASRRPASSRRTLLWLRLRRIKIVKDAQNSSVRVEIFDQAYNLRGSDAEYILKLAEYVDSKMRAVAEATNTIDTVRLAVLAALNIADEYHLLKKKQEGGATDYQKRAHVLADALDEVWAKTARQVNLRRAPLLLACRFWVANCS
jgi:cell division protein ZapA